MTSSHEYYRERNVAIVKEVGNRRLRNLCKLGRHQEVILLSLKIDAIVDCIMKAPERQTKFDDVTLLSEH